MKMLRCAIAIAIVLASGLYTDVSQAQTGVSADSAAAFMGNWNVEVAAEPPTTIRINITDDSGQVTAEVTGMEGNVTDVQSFRARRALWC